MVKSSEVPELKIVATEDTSLLEVVPSEVMIGSQVDVEGEVDVSVSEAKLVLAYGADTSSEVKISVEMLCSDSM